MNPFLTLAPIAAAAAITLAPAAGATDTRCDGTAGRFPGAVKPNDNQQARWLIPRTGIDNYLKGS